jgi:hypothetical protein
MHDIHTHNRVFLGNNDELVPGSVLRVRVDLGDPTTECNAVRPGWG